MRRTPLALSRSRGGSRASPSRSRRMRPGRDGRPETSPMRPQSRGSLIQLDGSYLFFADGGRSAATALANEWKRPSTTRGASYAQLASMLHLSGFREQVADLQEAMQDHGLVTNLDAHETDSEWSDNEPSVMSSSRSSSVLSQADGWDAGPSAQPLEGQVSGPEASSSATPLPSVQARLRELFTAIDADQNGTLSREELALKLRADTELQQLLADAGKSSHYVFEQLDRDGDGSITVDEFVRLCVPEDSEEEAEAGEQQQQEEEEEEEAEEEEEEEGTVEGATESLNVCDEDQVADRQASTGSCIPDTSQAFVERLFASAIGACLHDSRSSSESIAAPVPEPTPTTNVDASNETEADASSAPATDPLIASFADRFIHGLCRAAVAACAFSDDNGVETCEVTPVHNPKRVTFTETELAKPVDLVLPIDDGSQIQWLDEKQETSSPIGSRTPGGSVDLDKLLDRAASVVADGEKKQQDSKSEQVALGVTPGAMERREKHFTQRLVEQDFTFEKALIFARAAVAHEEALERAPKWSGDYLSDQFALRPLAMPASMALPTESSAADSPNRSGKPSFWKKLRAKAETKVETESGLHLQLFSSLVPADILPGQQEQQAAIVTIDLLEVSPLIAKCDAGSICCKIRTIDTRTQNAAVDLLPAVALSAFGPTLALKRSEALLVIEGVDSQNLELRVCTSESEDAAELCRVWMPASNLVSSSVEGHIVDVWLPAMEPPPQMDVSIKAEHRPRDDRSSGVDFFDLEVVIHSASNIRAGRQVTDVYATAQLAASGSTVVDDILCTTAIMEETADPRFGETFVIQQETLDAILARRREGTTLNLRFVIYRSNLLSNQSDVSVAEFEWADVYNVPRGQTLRRRLEPRASESEFHRVATAVARSQRVWRQQVVDRIDAMSSFRAIDTDGNGLLDSDELARVAYVMDGGALMTPKEVKVAEAEIAAGASDRDENALHAQPSAYALPMFERAT